MSFTETEVFRLNRLHDRLETKALTFAFNYLFSNCCMLSNFTVHPAPQGNFNVVQLRRNGRAHFAFKGSKQHMLWYFRDQNLVQI